MGKGSRDDLCWCHHECGLDGHTGVESSENRIIAVSILEVITYLNESGFGEVGERKHVKEVLRANGERTAEKSA